MNRLRLFISLAALFFALTSARAQIVINEIFYRPGTGFPENTALEFIEFYNRTATAVDLSGWEITAGTAFTFPAGTTIAAGGSLVVASDATLVQSTYGIAGVLGPWAAGTSLSNNGERITLSKPGVAAGSFIAVDSVTYASEGDWATRVRELQFNGWDWSTPADGGNRSMELRNPALSNDNGQNWAPSAATIGATPGAQNSVLTNNVPPIIHDVEHSPAVPKSSDPVTISCEVNDESAPHFLTATLFWREATSTNPGPFQQQTMTGDGAGFFSTTLGPKPHLTIVEFYISVTDGVGTRTWPAATSEGQNANCQYQVTNELLNRNHAYYFLVLTGAENAAYNAVAPFDSANNKIDQQFNTTLIVVNGNDTKVRYRSDIRFRGNSSRSYQFKPLRVSLPADDPLDGDTRFNLNPRSAYLQFLGMRMHQLGGVRAPDSIPVKPRRNGVEYSTSSGSTPEYGFWVREEDVGSDFVRNHFPNSPGGNVYLKGRPDRYWRSSGVVPSSPDATLDGWQKQNNSSANDWIDLSAFFATVQSAAAPHFPGAPINDVAQSSGGPTSSAGLWNGTGFTSPELASLETVADLDQWARWFAVMTILQDVETNISNGQDDDYGIYFAPNPAGQRRANLITHDMDTILGLGETPQSHNARGLFDMTDSGSVFRPLLPLFGNASQPGNVEFRQKYFDAIRVLYGTVFNADPTADPNPAFYQFLDSHLTGWAPAPTIASIKNFMTQRQSYLLGLIGSGPIRPPAATSSATFVSAPGAFMIHEVLASNVAAHLNGATYPDVIELYNSGDTAIVLDGKSLTDNPAVKAKYVFPAGTTLNGGSYLVVYADSDMAAPGFHTGFALDDESDDLYLYDTVESGQALLDSIAFGLQAPDYSIGRTGVGRETWTLGTPSIGFANSAVTVLAEPGGLKINEWAGNRDYLLTEDFIELLNSAAAPVALGLMSLTDDVINTPGKSPIPNLSFMAPGAIAVFTANGNSASAGNASELKFRIDANFGSVGLVGQNGTIVDRVEVVAQAADTSRGRTPDGKKTITTFGFPGNLPTPGASNLNPPPSVLSLVNYLRVSELNYTPTNLEYLELHNIGASVLDLSGVRLTQGVGYTFDSGATLAPGAYLVICRDRAAFQAQFGNAVPLAARTFTGTLDNAGETIALQPPAPWNVNILNFRYESTWFVPETNNGFALTVINDTTTAPRDWREKTTWSPAPVLYGTPGTDSPPTIVGPLAASGIAGVAFRYQIAATKNPTSYNAVPLPGGLTLNPATGLISGTPNVTGTFEIAISATNATGLGSRTLVLTITVPPPPVIASASTATGIVGTPFTYQIVASNNPTSYGALGLPAGLSFNSSMGLISGTPTQTGTFEITLSATNAFGTGTMSLALTVNLPALPVITSAGTASAVQSDPFTYQILATNSPSSYNAIGLPAGLTVNTVTGLISGTPAETGVFDVTLRATNPGGTATKTLTITVAVSGPHTGFAWSTIPSPQRVNTPFAGMVRAVDAQGRTVTSYNDRVNLSAGVGRSPATIGTGVEPWEYPLRTFWHDSRTQVIYLASEVGGAGRITALAINVTRLPGQTLNLWTLRMKHTSLSSYGTTPAWESGWTTVYQKNETIAATGWVTFTFTTPFEYNGVSNLLIDFSHNNTRYTDDGMVQSTSVPANRSLTYFTDSGFGDPLTWAGSSSPQPIPEARIPNVRLTFLQTAAVLSPTAVNFTNGIWSGEIAILQPASGILLKAEDNGGRAGQSNAFDVLGSALPVITSQANAFTAVGQPFSYQIVATNLPTNYAAANLPAGLVINASTGLVSGTPTVGGNYSVSLSAANTSGSATKVLMLQVMRDADGDGIGDAWENAYSLDPTNPMDALLDKDGDGQSNRAEWLAGTSPNLFASRFTITSMEAVTANMVITWSSVVGRRYRVFWNDGLSAESWVEATTAPMLGNGASTSFTHLGGTGGPRRFYRVSIQP